MSFFILMLACLLFFFLFSDVVCICLDELFWTMVSSCLTVQWKVKQSESESENYTMTQWCSERFLVRFYLKCVQCIFQNFKQIWRGCLSCWSASCSDTSSVLVLNSSHSGFILIFILNEVIGRRQNWLTLSKIIHNKIITFTEIMVIQIKKKEAFLSLVFF